MADTLQFDLVSPERRLASVQAREVAIPGAAGDLVAMPGHAATVTTLRPGILRAVTSAEARSYLVTGGFAEITPEGVTVLAELAIPTDEATGTIVDEILAEAKALAAAALPENRDEAEKHVADIEAMRAGLFAH